MCWSYTERSRATDHLRQTAFSRGGWRSGAYASFSSITATGIITATSRNNVVLKAQEVDKATAALITDLKQRGMLDDTLVIWGGEFGRTPMSQGRGGRDHHIKGFSFMFAGGGIKKGLTYGATDDLGYAAVENPVSVHDFHATMLYLLGVDASKARGEVSGTGRPTHRRARRHRRPRHHCVGRLSTMSVAWPETALRCVSSGYAKRRRP